MPWRYVAGGTFTVDAARDLTYTVRANCVKPPATVRSPKVAVADMVGTQGHEAHLSQDYSLSRFGDAWFGNRSPSAVLQCKRGGRTVRSDLGDYT